MAILNPSKLETIDYGQQWWQHIFNANAQKENDIFNKLSGLWDGTAVEGQVVVYNASLDKWVPSAVPYPVPQAAIALTIGAGADTAVNAGSSKFFTLTLTKNTNLIVSNMLDGMVIDIVFQQDSVGGWAFTFSSGTVVGTVATDPDIYTWVRCFKVSSVFMINVVGNFVA